MPDSSQRISSPRTTLRFRILALVAGLALLSLVGSALSLYRITDVNRSMDAINRVSVPLGRKFVRLRSDAELYQREFERRLGSTHWSDPRFAAKPVPKWVEDVLASELDEIRELILKEVPWSNPESVETWRSWLEGAQSSLTALADDAKKLPTLLDQHQSDQAAQVHTRWISNYEAWLRNIEWAQEEQDRALRKAFAQSETRVTELRTGMEVILVVVVSLSLLLLWLGERALRPLENLTQLARAIARRGLRREDKAALPEIPLSRQDEVSQLAREFHAMATALLEREKTVETQNQRLEDQNRKLREMGELNSRILKSLESILVVTDLEGRIQQVNPAACSQLGVLADTLIGQPLLSFEWFASLPGSAGWLERSRLESGEAFHLDSLKVNGKIYGGSVIPLRSDTSQAYGAIIQIDDLTSESELQDRLQYAERLAAVGRMSAQVAHEVRNPLHSIGLEAEMAGERAARLGDRELKRSLDSIMASVDRLGKITENYLTLSRLSSGKRDPVDLGEILETVLATYSSAFESKRVRVDWTREGTGALSVSVDKGLLEQALGNLVRNSLEAVPPTTGLIQFKLGRIDTGRVWLRVEDNGSGIPPSARAKLFTPFFTTRAKGTGLGLSFVKKAVEEQGGTIECHPYVSGKGALFELSFPEIEISIPRARVAGVQPPSEDGRHGEATLS